MNEWKPIETYDELRKKPKLAVFWFEEMVGKRDFLPPMAHLERRFGNRVCTHWMPLPEPPK